MPSSNGPRKGTRDKLKNRPRDRGISPPQRSVEQYAEGEKVHLRLDPSNPKGQFHHRFNGQTGTVVGQQGAAYKVEIIDGGVTKTVIARPAHLRRQRTEQSKPSENSEQSEPSENSEQSEPSENSEQSEQTEA